MSITTSICVSLLMGSSGLPAIHPTSSERLAAQDWLEIRAVKEPTDEQQLQVLGQWEDWQKVSSENRDGYLGLELRMISPHQNGSVTFLSGHRQALEKLSQRNLERWKTRLAELRPLNPKAEENLGLRQTVRDMSKGISFHYLRAYTPLGETGFLPPLGSPLEESKFGFGRDNYFYSQLLDHAPSVGFNVIAANSSVGPLNINSSIRFSALRLHQDFAARYGFVLPQFRSTSELLNFFKVWQPERLDELYLRNQVSLPPEIRNTDQFLAYIKNEKVMRQVFPSHSYFDRLSVLRQELYHYVLTEKDARQFLVWAFERYLLSVASEDSGRFLSFRQQFNSRAASPQSVYAGEFAAYLNVPNFSLRIPVSVPSKDYSTLTLENVAYEFPHRNSYAKGNSIPRWLDQSLKQ